MRTRAALSGVFASVAILVVGWQAGAAGVPSGTASSTTPGISAGSAAGSALGGTSRDSTSAGIAPAPALSDGAYAGDPVRTRYGDVQVQVTVTGGAITDVAALQLTDSGRESVTISNRAAPLLRAEVLASQSAGVSTIGGATYTSDAYLSSLQSALDRAGS